MELRREKLSACEICGDVLPEDAPALRFHDSLGITDEAFTYVECAKCRTWIQNPRPTVEEMERFYGEGFLLDTSSEEMTRLVRIGLFLRQFNLYFSEFRWMLKHMKEGCRYLDYSAGNGEVIAMLARRRKDVRIHATEFSAKYRELLARHIRSDAVGADIGDFGRNAKFDLITAYGVLEHVFSPRETISLFHQHLEPGGKAIVTVPNPASFQRWISGEKWWGWLAPRHMYLMKMDALVRLFEEQGFRVIEKKHFLARYSSLQLALSLFPRLEPIRASSLGLLALGALTYGMLPVEWAASLFGKGGFMGLVAVKE